MKRIFFFLLLIFQSYLAIWAQTPPALTTNLSRPYIPEKGLEGRHIALWGSHGLYYELGNARWEWQRARIMQAVEDKYPTSYVLQYVVPMLENAGANVLMPRERDTNPHEMIVDADGHLATGHYAEKNGHHKWKEGNGKGFVWDKEVYLDGENPFERGTYRQVATIQADKGESHATWTPHVTADGRYAVYVSYHSLPNSATDALYTIYHKGGKTSFRVNQQMGGGTWIYLGTFTFSKHAEHKVVLSNVSADNNAIITADAVKFGGGMGNVARGADGSRVYENTKRRKSKASSRPRNAYEPILDLSPEVSGAPRWLEGARYNLQWAGMPMSVYSPSKGQNDYTDDYQCRGAWVNYLAGGSRVYPKGEGLRIPIDCSFGFHTDGGDKPGNELVGTLSIYTTSSQGGKLGDGSSRRACARLSDGVYKSIMDDVSRLMEPQWRGRKSVDRGYNESSTPVVPSMLLELLSHENFADMRWGLDPRFKFVVGRAIYKGILRFISARNATDYVVQPLPVSHLAAIVNEEGKAQISWRPVEDPLEPTAKPQAYAVYQRTGDGDFDNGTLVEDTIYLCTIPKDKVVSFRITAVNQGGQSMPSEVLSVGISSHSTAAPVLVINGFTRVSGPDDFVSSDDKQAGFLAWQDGGVPDGRMLEYAGAQKEFSRSVEWTDDDSPGFGSSNGEYEQMVIAGNTFDYPALHGLSILRAGHSFVSLSREAACSMSDSLLAVQYSVIDLILGKQKQTKLGRPGVHPLDFKTFDAPMQRLLTTFCHAGGNVFVSGSYVASDLWHNPLAPSLEGDRNFAQQVLKYQWRDDKASTCGQLRTIPSPLFQGQPKHHPMAKIFGYWNKPNETSYVVESPDCIIPADAAAVPAFRYAEGGKPAGIVFGGNATDHWRTVVLGFPFESICSSEVRDAMMQQILHFFQP